MQVVVETANFGSKRRLQRVAEDDVWLYLFLIYCDGDLLEPRCAA